MAAPPRTRLSIGESGMSKEIPTDEELQRRYDEICERAGGTICILCEDRIPNGQSIYTTGPKYEIFCEGCVRDMNNAPNWPLGGERRRRFRLIRGGKATEGDA